MKPVKSKNLPDSKAIKSGNLPDAKPVKSKKNHNEVEKQKKWPLFSECAVKKVLFKFSKHFIEHART